MGFLDLLVRWLDKITKTYSSNGGEFNGDESHGIESEKILEMVGYLDLLQIFLKLVVVKNGDESHAKKQTKG